MNMNKEELNFIEEICDTFDIASKELFLNSLHRYLGLEPNTNVKMEINKHYSYYFNRKKRVEILLKSILQNSKLILLDDILNLNANVNNIKKQFKSFVAKHKLGPADYWEFELFFKECL